MEQDPKALAGESTDFFVSNTGADIVWAEWIAWQLEAEGHRLCCVGHEWSGR